MSNLAAFLQMIAVSEIGGALLAKSDRGYNVIVGSTYAHPNLFHSYRDHPRVMVKLSESISSSAAGRYQILGYIFDYYKKMLHLPDFSPTSQDAIAYQLIKECHAIDDINDGRFAVAVYKCRSRWASLPNSNYAGQRMSRLADLEHAYLQAGGKIA